MKKKHLYFFFLIALMSCSVQDRTESEKMPALYPAPKKIPFNPHPGYLHNQSTGDSIQALITSFGDTVVTGTPITITGQRIDPDSVQKPKVVPAGKPNISRTNLNVHPITNEPETIHLDPGQLSVFIPGADSTNFVLVNSIGDTIPTGISIPAKGKEIPCKQPRLIKTLHPQARETATKHIKYLDVDQGMSSSYISSIMEDAQGNLWFGTDGGGVCKYDGATILNYTTQEGLSSNEIWTMFIDSRENIWFGTNGGGVCKYDGTKFTHFTEKEGLSSDVIRSVIEDNEGNLWFGTNGSGVSRFDGKSFIHFTQKEGLSHNKVMSMLEDHDGNMWFGTDGGGVCKYDGKNFTHFTQREGLCHNSIWTIAEDRNNNLWFGSHGMGVSKFDGKSFTNFTQENGLSLNAVWSIIEDRNGNMWFATYGGGACKYDGEKFIHYGTDEGLTNNSIRTLFEDRSGNIWLGTNGGGVNFYKANSFTHFTEKEGLSHIAIWSILEDSKGNLWLGTFGGGVSKYDGITFTNYTIAQGLSSNSVISMIEDRNGNLWFATFDGGVCKYDGDEFTHYTDAEGLGNNTVWSMTESRNGDLWFCTNGGGISKFDGTAFTRFTEKEGFSSNTVLSVLEDDEGNLWFGTYGAGVSKYDGATFTNYTEREGLPNGTIWSITQDKHKNLWFGTNGAGAARFDGQSFTCYSEKEGLPNGVIWSIHEDDHENLWLGTESGLACLAPTEHEDDSSCCQRVVHEFGKVDGLKGMDFFLNSVFLDSKNHIWWGSGKSLTSLSLDTTLFMAKTPSVQLVQIEISDRFLDFRNISDTTIRRVSFDSVPRFSNYPANLKLPYRNNHLTFHFSATDWTAPHKVKYSYRIKELDEIWSHPTDESKADYRSLPYGKFTFQIRAIGAAQKWSEPYEYTFLIHPPWWHTWWARSGYVLIVVIFIFGFIRLRMAKLKRRQKELESEVMKATWEIRKQKEEVERQKTVIEKEKDRSEELLLNILPAETAEELKKYGHAEAKSYDTVSVLFTDFKGFTQISERLSPEELVLEIDYCYKAFDQITEKYGIEKIKTIGDAYMAAGGVPTTNTSNPTDTVSAALEIRDFMLKYKAERNASGREGFEIRIGVHTGPVVAGIVGIKKFAYDIWGDTVNTAARMENSGEVGKVNISGSTYELVKDQFQCTYRGKVMAKNKGEIDMYFVEHPNSAE